MRGLDTTEIIIHRGLCPPLGSSAHAAEAALSHNVTWGRPSGAAHLTSIGSLWLFGFGFLVLQE
jgi:hypothetical protein